MDVIRLSRIWTLGALIGDPSGFGKVYQAVADDGTIAAIKLVPKEPGAEREILFEEISGVENVIPIIDTGEFKDYWVIVMPRAERSLRAHLATHDGTLPLNDALPILVDIAQALAELDGRVVHRDLKPENILLFNGHWCLADFGIARYADASTQPDTRKFAMSPPYSAPERWRHEHATSAADVYSFGVMAWEILTGRPLFSGPALDDFREQHLHFPPFWPTSRPHSPVSFRNALQAPGSRPSSKTKDSSSSQARACGLSAPECVKLLLTTPRPPHRTSVRALTTGHCSSAALRSAWTRPSS
ncbi:MAG: serine/threonine protein kinase [Ardenticatenia bacterium]|nr:serine/threonine protein kinase [Ardenticatenia bacterium]